MTLEQTPVETPEELSRSRDEWRTQAAKNAGRIEELRTAAEGIWPFVSKAYSNAPLQPDFQAALDRLGAALGKG